MLPFRGYAKRRAGSWSRFYPVHGQPVSREPIRYPENVAWAIHDLTDPLGADGSPPGVHR